MASPVDLIHYKVNKFLYSRQTTMTFLQCGNCLIEGRVLSAEEVERHHDEIRGLYLAWKAGFDAQDGGNHQPQPMDPPRDPPIPESLAPHAALSNDSPSSPPEGTWEATDRAGLKEALSKIDPEWPFDTPAITILLLPGDPYHHGSARVNRMETSCGQSYIRAVTLEKCGIRCKGRTINIQWQSKAVSPGRDEGVQNTCFVVVSKTMAEEVGLSFDMLVGADHGRPLSEQIQALGAEETISAGSSTTDQTEDLSAHSFDDSRSAELHPMPDMYHSPPRGVRLVLSGSSEGVADFIRKLGASGGGMSKTIENPAGHLIGLHSSGPGKRDSSSSDDSGGHSRKHRPAGR